jgi:hypothetical protein
MTRKLSFWANKGLFPVLVAVSMMNFLNAAAVKPGLASKTGNESARSMWRRSVSKMT